MWYFDDWPSSWQLHAAIFCASEAAATLYLCVCTCMCVCVYIYTCMCVCVYIYEDLWDDLLCLWYFDDWLSSWRLYVATFCATTAVPPHIFVCEACVCVHVCVRECVWVCVSVRLPVCMYICMCRCVRVSVYMCECMHLWVCVCLCARVCVCSYVRVCVFLKESERVRERKTANTHLCAGMCCRVRRSGCVRGVCACVCESVRVCVYVRV